jgi:hypothetical protein
MVFLYLTALLYAGVVLASIALLIVIALVAVGFGLIWLVQKASDAIWPSPYRCES